MDKIPCPWCDKTIQFESYIDPEDYEGVLVCKQGCKSILYIKLVNSKVRTLRIKEKGTAVDGIPLEQIRERMAKSAEEFVKRVKEISGKNNVTNEQ